MTSAPPAPPDRPGRAWTVGVPVFLAVVTTLLTWPLAMSPGLAAGMREDYFLSLWNFWWVREALLDGSLSLYVSDAIHHPLGVSLDRHLLNPVSAIPGALLSTFLSFDATYKILLWIHFWLSAWTFTAFARAITASPGGALLAGLFWSFSPFHFFALSMLNVATMEFLPLAGWFMVRCYRHGGAANAAGLAASAALLAGSSPYFLVYAGLLGAALWAGGPLWAPEIEARRGLMRLGAAAVAAGAAVAAVGWRLLLADSGADDPTAMEETLRQLSQRANDLLGFLWVVPPERVIVSWPTLFGYSSLALIALGVNRRRDRLFWLGLAVGFGVLSLGGELRVGDRGTGIPLPYRLFSELPVLWQLRKPDRMVVLALLAAGVLLAFGWRELAHRLGTPERRRTAWAAAAAVMCVERLAAPVPMFDPSVSPRIAEIAELESVEVVAHLPPYGGGPAAGRTIHYQTIHGRKVTEGYVVNLALGPEHRDATRDWRQAYARLLQGDALALVDHARSRGVDLLVLHKTVPVVRKPEPVHERVVWAPFVFVHRTLVGLRQRGPVAERRLTDERIDHQRAALAEHLGPPVLEDASLMAFTLD